MYTIHSSPSPMLYCGVHFPYSLGRERKKVVEPPQCQIDCFSRCLWIKDYHGSIKYPYHVTQTHIKFPKNSIVTENWGKSDAAIFITEREGLINLILLWICFIDFGPRKIHGKNSHARHPQRLPGSIHQFFVEETLWNSIRCLLRRFKWNCRRLISWRTPLVIGLGDISF